MQVEPQKRITIEDILNMELMKRDVSELEEDYEDDFEPDSDNSETYEDDFETCSSSEAETND